MAENPLDEELRITVSAAITAWVASRPLPYISPSAFQGLNDLLLFGLRPVVERARENGRGEQREDDRYGER